MGFFKKLFVVAVAIIAVVATGPLAAAFLPTMIGIIGPGLAASVAAGVAAGAITGAASALLTGQKVGKGALMGAIGGGIAGGTGMIAQQPGADVAGGLTADAAAVAEQAAPAAVQSSSPAALGEVGKTAGQTVAEVGGSAPGEASGTFTQGFSSPPPQPPPAGGMLDKFTEFTKAHPWTKDLYKPAIEAGAKGLASAFTPSEAEQAMELDEFRRKVLNQSVQGLSSGFGSAPGARPAPLQRTGGQPVFQGGGMLALPQLKPAGA